MRTLKKIQEVVFYATLLISTPAVFGLWMYAMEFRMIPEIVEVAAKELGREWRDVAKEDIIVHRGKTYIVVGTSHGIGDRPVFNVQHRPGSAFFASNRTAIDIRWGLAKGTAPVLIRKGDSRYYDTLKRFEVGGES